MENKTVDVIIPAYHPGKEFATLIKRLEKQSVPIHRIIVMNTEESMWNKEWEKLSDVMEIHHLAKSEFDHGGTRAQAAELSDADVMIFMTQDAMPADRELLAELLKALEQDENIAAAYARQLPNAECSFVERYTRAFNYSDRSVVKTKKDMDQYGIKTFFCSNVCAAYKKDIYQKQGGFVRRTIFNEDMIYAGGLIQAGYGIAYAAEAKVIHSHNYNCMQQFHRNFDLGVSQAEHPEIFEGVPSEGEGMRLVKKTLSHLVRSGKIWLIPGFVMQCAGKYAGYLAGKNFRRLPKKFVLWCTMSPNYWK
ncbi:glycosyltransferase [Ruminococcus sp. AF17-22AC]|uniref:glycosyltransferase family 2 protein n=1 Tax=Ruminococcus sp. AF17-22AC TaxID=2292248 RepID=UPI000E4FA251|nr:glycosyltransferase family 2 protein [Ruminococcus sp. AF17-22AC]RGU31177.1 glycosyltransferase [Ruminococcus sp. AF17-22AC]